MLDTVAIAQCIVPQNGNETQISTAADGLDISQKGRVVLLGLIEATDHQLGSSPLLTVNADLGAGAESGETPVVMQRRE